MVTKTKFYPDEEKDKAVVAMENFEMATKSKIDKVITPPAALAETRQESFEMVKASTIEEVITETRQINSECKKKISKGPKKIIILC